MSRRLLQFRVQARQPGIVERKPARSDQAEKRKRDSGRNSSGFRPQQPCPTHAHFRSPCLNSVYLDPPEPMLEPPPEPPVPLRSEEHTSELQSLMRISYAVFCLKKKKSHIHY